jgi:hypothetical protein
LSARAGDASRRAARAEAGSRAGATGLGAFAIYEAAIRPFAVSRFLFGVKPKAASKGLPQPAAPEVSPI